MSLLYNRSMKQSYFRISFLQFLCIKETALRVFGLKCFKMLGLHYALCTMQRWRHGLLACSWQLERGNYASKISAKENLITKRFMPTVKIWNIEVWDVWLVYKTKNKTSSILFCFHERLDRVFIWLGLGKQTNERPTSFVAWELQVLVIFRLDVLGYLLILWLRALEKGWWGKLQI